MTFDILAFCRKRNISTEGIRIVQAVDWNTRKTDDSRIKYRVEVPPEFPEKYRKALIAVGRSCLVSKLAGGVDKATMEFEVKVAG